jgi:hypothetical protein
LPSNAVSIEIFLSFQITTTGDSNKHTMFSLLCKYHFILAKINQQKCLWQHVSLLALAPWAAYQEIRSNCLFPRPQEAKTSTSNLTVSQVV